MLLASIRKIIREFSYFIVSTARYYKLRKAFSPNGIVAISLIDPCYTHFYEPIVKSLLEDDKYTVISFGSTVMGLPTFSRYTHWVIKEPLIILCVDAESYKKSKSRDVFRCFMESLHSGLCMGMTI